MVVLWVVVDGVVGVVGGAVLGSVVVEAVVVDGVVGVVLDSVVLSVVVPDEAVVSSTVVEVVAGV